MINKNRKKILADLKKCTSNKNTAAKIVYKIKIPQFIFFSGYINIFNNTITNTNAINEYKV